MESELQKRIERQGIVISRLPKWAKEIFIARAQEEFCDDYGMCLAAMVKECGEYNKLKQMFLENNLNVSLLFNNPQIKNEEIKNPIKFGNGKQLNNDGGQK